MDRLRACGVPFPALDFIRLALVKKPDTRYEMDGRGLDQRIVWDFDFEFWRDELPGLRVELADRCGLAGEQ